MRNKITTEELIKKRFSDKKAQQIFEEINKEVETIKRGGARPNSGRKTTVRGKILKFTKRLTDKEAQFIEYARAHNLNYDDLMQG